MAEIKCLRCQGQMEEGLLIESRMLAPMRLFWLQGKPQKTWIGNVKTDPSKMVSTISYRCTICGYLESYAEKKQEKESI